MEVSSPAQIYQGQIQKHEALLKKLQKKRNLLGWLRLLVFIATIIASFKIFVAAGLIGLAPAILGLSVFIYFIFIDADNNEKITNTKTHIGINEEELRVLSNNFSNCNEGLNYLPTAHDYAHDLDIFGKVSVFQLINRCSTEQGQKLLAKNLLHPLTRDEIIKRQEAAAELSPMTEWRQQLQSFSRQTTLTISTE